MSAAGHHLLWLMLLAGLMVVGCRNQPPSPSPEAPAPKEINGYTVQGDFLYVRERYEDGAGLGLPLTEEMIVDGWRVQYFEKGRLEYHPENEAAYRVTVGWLGDLLHRRRPPIPPGAQPRADDTNRRYYPQTGHTLSGDFLAYFDAHGGSVRFGLPISEPFLWAGRLTQDFQSARFFWEPGQVPPVRLEDTGRVHLERLTAEGNLRPK